MKNLNSWGNHPKIKNNVFRLNNRNTLKQVLKKNVDLIPFGNGRSYGDSALSTNIIDVRPSNNFIDFNNETGLLHLQAGVLLADIIQSFVPRGWFLRITPGTKFITIGGAIASDIHGKNHHSEGCFSECLKEFTIMHANGNIVNCSKEKKPELFKATCGGQGLTGVILSAKIFLIKINSMYLNQTTIKTKNLRETFEAFEKYKNNDYSVAWIDCFAKKNKLGKCLLMLGEFSNDGNLKYKLPKQKKISFYFPKFILNSFIIRCFNLIYYNRVRKQISHKKTDIDSFFYPLDSIMNWNRIYGKQGFLQYQFILPKTSSYEGLKKILTEISNSKRGSFLSVLKLHGRANSNYLSFPLEGYSLALDFKIDKGIFDFLDMLDEIVLEFNGRIYLAKDARINKKNFEQGYSNIKNFRNFRNVNNMKKKFESLQSKRVEI
jgi:decaprenylphospho-beta-D-ribofuranose 2-oxidase